jgi:hypothetical protein
LSAWVGSLLVSILRRVLPAANPDFDDQYARVVRWWVEVDSKGLPIREIGFDRLGAPIVLAPIGPNRGCITDSLSTFVEWSNDARVQGQFEETWQRLVKAFASTHRA